MRTALLIGILSGLCLGLAYAWLIAPVEFVTADPYHVSPIYRDVWIVMAAEAHAAGADWDRTTARLTGLRDPNLPETLAAAFERANRGGSNPQARALAQLAARLGEPTAPMLVYLITPAVTPTSTPQPPTSGGPTLVAPPATLIPAGPTAAPTLAAPTPTPTATPTPEYELINRASVCDSRPPQIRVNVRDVAGNDLPGVEVWITWSGGADRLVTGLKPEYGEGFGDFDMEPGIAYGVGAGTQSALALASDLRADECPGGHLSWSIVLQAIQP